MVDFGVDTDAISIDYGLPSFFAERDETPLSTLRASARTAHEVRYNDYGMGTILRRFVNGFLG